MFAETKKQIDALVEVATAGADPLAVADMFFDQTMTSMSDEDYGKLADMIEGQSFLTQMAVLNPRVKEFAPFFENMRNRLVQRIIEADPDGAA